MPHEAIYIKLLEKISDLHLIEQRTTHQYFTKQMNSIYKLHKIKILCAN